MNCPLIYTATRLHDFRCVTSKSMAGVPDHIQEFFTAVAHTMIDTTNRELEEPSWVLVKKDGYTLWGMASLNKALGEKCDDRDMRPARGFFGFVSDSSLSRLPYGPDYFKELYAVYVDPIWESFDPTRQIVAGMPAIVSSEFIDKSSLLANKINTDSAICRLFPSSADSKGLLAAVLDYDGDCSIAVNVHRSAQSVEFGPDKDSFANAVMSPSAGIAAVADVKVAHASSSMADDHVVAEVQPPVEIPTDKRKKILYGLYIVAAITFIILAIKDLI